jgi:histidinol-phosphate phosphatase family protein
VTAPEPPDRSSPRSSRSVLAVTGEQRTSLREIRPAIFFDRDGTLIRDVGYVKNPEDVELVPHAVNAVRRMNYQLWPVIVITNQSGIARGFLSEGDYDRVRERIDDLVQERGAYVTAHYHCPHHPDFTGPCECRKPGTALFDKAIYDHAINPALSVFVGDRWRDIAPAWHYGARGILVPNEGTPAEEIEKARTEMEVAQTLSDAVHKILQV